jgi:hypothetical protein
MSSAKTAPTELTQAEKEWLAAGGGFPPEVTLADESGRRWQLTLLDRADDGTVTGIRAGTKGFVLRARDNATGLHYAVKLCVPGDYNEVRSARVEVQRAANLSFARELFALPEGWGQAERFETQPEPRHEWTCFVIRWVEGPTLEELLAERARSWDLTPTSVIKLCMDLLQAVLVLREAGLKHDDLHTGNVKISPVPASMRVGRRDLPETRVVVIDTGSLKPLAQAGVKAHDDWTRLIETFTKIHGAMHRDRAFATRHATFLTGFETYISQLADHNQDRHFLERESYFDRLEDLLKDGSTHAGGAPFKPFDGISAEHLAGDEEILNLFVGTLPWIQKALSNTPSVVTGPRGCGKSMVFRYLSARTHLLNGKTGVETLGRLGLFGIYIPCSSDLQNEVLWIARTPGLPRELSHELVTLFGLILAREFFRSVALAERSPQASTALGVDAHAVRRLVSFCKEYFHGVTWKARWVAHDSAESFASELDHLRIAHSRHVLRGAGPPHRLPSTFFKDLCRHAISLIPGLQRLPICVLLDDYSHPRIPEEIQHVLNPIIWTREPGVRFKVSCERWGFRPVIDGNVRVDEDREFVNVDAARTTWLKPAEKQVFVVLLLNRRLQRAGYAGKIEDLLGPSEHPTDRHLARALKDDPKQNNDSREYHGIEVFSNLLGGDVATLLNFGREIFVQGGVEAHTTDRVPPRIQHVAIIKVSRSLVGQIETFHPHGASMHAIAQAFGQLARRLLIEGTPNEKGRPRKLIRMEISLKGVSDFYAELSRSAGNPDVEALAKELVRRSIFTDLSPSGAKEGLEYRTFRWQMRAALLPSFILPLGRESYIDMKRVEDWVELLTNPTAQCAKIFPRYAQLEKTGDLFGGGAT